MSSGSTDSNRLSAWPNFIAPPLSSPSTRNSCRRPAAGAPRSPLGRARRRALAEAEGGPAGEAERQGREPGPAAQADRASGSSVSLIWWGTPGVCWIEWCPGRSVTILRAGTNNIRRPDRPTRRVAARTTHRGPSSTVADAVSTVRPARWDRACVVTRAAAQSAASGSQSARVRQSWASIRGQAGSARVRARSRAAQAAGPAREHERAHHRTPGPWSYEQVRVTGLGQSRGDGPIDLEAGRQHDRQIHRVDRRGGPVVGRLHPVPPVGPARPW